MGATPGEVSAMVGTRDERMRHLAHATWRVIADRGIAAVSVRSVAVEAGMAVGSLRHLFPTQQALLEFSGHLMLEQATARVTAIASQDHEDVVHQAQAVIAELMPFTPTTRREFEINLALIAETPRTPTLAGIRDAAHRDLLDLFRRLVSMVADRDVQSCDDDARRLLALVDGLSLHLLHQAEGEDARWARRIIASELTRLHEHGARDG